MHSLSFGRVMVIGFIGVSMFGASYGDYENYGNVYENASRRGATVVRNRKTLGDVGRFGGNVGLDETRRQSRNGMPRGNYGSYNSAYGWSLYNSEPIVYNRGISGDNSNTGLKREHFSNSSAGFRMPSGIRGYDSVYGHSSRNNGLGTGRQKSPSGTDNKKIANRNGASTHGDTFFDGAEYSEFGIQNELPLNFLNINR